MKDFELTDLLIYFRKSKITLTFNFLVNGNINAVGMM